MTVRTALVGYGYWGANLARNLAAAGSIDLVAVADPAPDQRELVAARLPGVRTLASFDDVLADDEVEAVVLATPAAVHGVQALAVLESGRHVMVEKPLAMDPVEAWQIAELAEERALIAMVGHTFLYSPPVTWLRDAVQAGELGAVQYLYSQRLSLGKIRTDCNALWNLAPHDVSIMCHLLDETPVEVSSTGFSFLQSGIEDVSFATLTFPSGVGAGLHVSWMDPRKTRLTTVVGDQKMAVFDDVSPDNKIWMFDAGVASDRPSLGEYAGMGEFQWRTRSGDITIPKIAMKEPLLAEVEDFGRSCASGDQPLASARHGAQVVEVLAAITESARLGGTTVPVGGPAPTTASKENS